MVKNKKLILFVLIAMLSKSKFAGKEIPFFKNLFPCSIIVDLLGLQKKEFSEILNNISND
ncbi:hypothetical protein BpHYR1_051093 [Brachionus plicatilis]|uniref:Uncharacterized protein n=1 Tax=Brachionus plicatilis TaxID=10195 RepID=A0A3M7QGS5_BRAPC|nr:hypothetical protein BpHYR1_051093 [Brachionus plicatilis]